MNLLAQITALLNIPINILGQFFLAPVSFMPGWLSNTIVSAIAGVVLLIIFKYTSNQAAIGKARDAIKANMIALKLFKDSVPVILHAQGQVFKGAMLLLFYAIVPMLVMIIPVSLLLGQLGLWYQSRPLLANEEAVITMKLNESDSFQLPKVSMVSMPEVKVTVGPVRVLSKCEIYWKIRAQENGYHNIVFNVDKQLVNKQIAIGDGFMRVSMKRPGWQWADIFLHPLEKPFGTDEVVQSIDIDYPDRRSKTSGTDWWIGYFFVASLIFALLFKPFLKVRI